MVDPLMGGSPSAHPDRYKAASHGELLPTGIPTMLVIAERDEGFRDFGRSFAQRAAAAGEMLLRVVNAPGAGHFDVVAPPTPTFRLVLQTLRELFASIR